MILVTGGTGLVGAHLLYQLVQVKTLVRAIYRDEKKFPKVLEVFGFYSEAPQALFDQIQWVKADITDLASLQAHFEDIEQVYHCAALISFDPRHINNLMKINVEGTANIINLSLKYHVKKFCHVSSIAAIGFGKGLHVNEDTEWNEANATVYGISKFESELEVWRGSQEGLSVVIVNPGIILGPGFWNSGSGILFKMAHEGGRYFFPGGSGFVSVHDVVLSMTQLMKSAIENERFILVNQNLSYQEVFQLMASSFKTALPSKQVPLWLLEILWRLDFLKNIISGSSRKLTKNIVKGLYHTDLYDNSKSKGIPGFDYKALGAIIDFCSEKFIVQRNLSSSLATYK